MNMEKWKELFTYLRNGIAFSFSWLVMCTLVWCGFNGMDSIKIEFLFQLLVLCFGATLSFIVCFMNVFLKKKSFIFRLTLFYLLFIPVEIILFFRMHVFKNIGCMTQWLIFAAVVLSLYLMCVLLDWTVFRKKGIQYTKQVNAYNERRKNEQSREHTGK